MKNIFILILALFPLVAHSQDFDIGRLSDGTFETMDDYVLSVCVEDSATVLGDCQCYERYSKKWSVGVDSLYNIVFKVLSGNRKQLFKTSHESWVKYKDNELEASYEIYRNLDEGGGIYDYHKNLVKIYRTRFFELIEYTKRIE